MIAAADRHGFITVSPHGVGNSWALFCGGCTVADQAGVDDVGFVARLINHLGEHLSIDRGRIFAAGISDGGSFTNRLACQYPLAGAAVLAGTMFFPPALCQPTTDVSVIGFHGTDDSLIHISAGYGPIQMWARLGGCDDEPVVTPLPDLEPADRTTVERYDFTGCESGTAVVFYSIVNGGHNWPGTGGGLGLPNFDVNASEEIMDFFSTRSVTP
jgi:polyhydroxybutyrate depolymerase